MTDSLTSLLTAWQSSPWLPLLVIASFVIGSALFIPITALILSTAYLMSPVPGAVCSFIGVICGSMVGYGFGRLAGKKKIEQIVPKKILSRIRESLKDNEILSVAIIRKLPIAPFTVVNMVLGALKVPPIYFALGSGLGLMPIIILVALFNRSYKYAMSNPGWKEWGLWLGLLLLALGLAIFLQRALKRAAGSASKG